MDKNEPNQTSESIKIWDWIVVGTGVGGSTFGHALAQSGRRVLFIEKGADQRTNRQKKAGKFLESFVSNPAARDVEDYRNTGRSHSKIWDATRRRWLKPILGSGTGGSSALFGMVMERFWKQDFKPSRWPVSFNEMEPYYEEAERLFQVSSLDTDPLRPEQTFHHALRPSLPNDGALLMASLQAKGLHPYTLPLARTWDTTCPFCQSFLCEHDCKNDAAKIGLEPALQKHGASLLTDATVLEILADSNRVTGVRVEIDGGVVTIHSKNVALAAGAIFTPVLLLKSRSNLHPHGLANRSGQVGRNLMRHYIDLWGVPTESIEDKGAQKEVALNDFYHHNGEKFGTLSDFGKMPPLPVVLEDLDHEMSQRGTVQRTLWRVVRPLAGWFLGRLLARHRFMAFIMEDLPFSHNRVEEGTEGADVTIHYTVNDQEKARITRARSLVKKMLGIKGLLSLPNAENTKLLAHACGTCRMGDDPSTSVVNRYNRAHDLQNLYVVDASFFPTSGGANPALTIAANALRVARHVVDTSSDQTPQWPVVEPCTKKTVLFMPGAFSLAHVGRLVSLAQALPLDKYRVVFACDEHARRFIPSVFEHKPVTSLSSAEFRRRLDKGSPLVDETMLRKQVEEDIFLLSVVQPDLVVGDFRLSLSISARKAGVPYMNVTNAHWSPWAKEPFQIASPPDVAPLKILGSRLGLQITKALLPLFFYAHSRPFNHVRKEFGLRPLRNDLKEFYSDGDFTALADLTELVETPGAPADTHQSIGPVLWEPEGPLPVWWDDLPADKPLIYVTMGSTGETKYLPKLLAALEQLPVVVAVATAGRTTVSAVAGKRYVADFLPGTLLCQRAALVINNGGAGGVYQALAEGVPVLGIVANTDQCLVMNPVVRAGAGRKVMPNEVETFPWKKHLMEMLASRPLRETAQSIAGLFSATSAPNKFCHWVNKILDTKKTPLSPPKMAQEVPGMNNNVPLGIL